jgi:PBP1b-binding outer membrane lipoprotein LpoB
MKNILIICMVLLVIVFLAGCTKTSQVAAPNVPSDNIDSSSSSASAAAGSFVNDTTPTADQVVPDLGS